MNNYRTKRLVYVAVLCAIELVFQFVGNFVGLGPISLNLSLIPITFGAIVFGPCGGALLGLINGVVVLLSPNTWALFMPNLLTALGTVLLCLAKCTIAGFVGGLLNKIISHKSKVSGHLTASIVIPIINTAIFAAAALVLYRTLLVENSKLYANIYAYLFLGFLGWNFIFELLTTIVFTPILVHVFAKYVPEKNLE